MVVFKYVSIRNYVTYSSSFMIVNHEATATILAPVSTSDAELLHMLPQSVSMSGLLGF